MTLTMIYIHLPHFGVSGAILLFVAARSTVFIDVGGWQVADAQFVVSSSQFLQKAVIRACLNPQHRMHNMTYGLLLHFSWTI